MVIEKEVDVVNDSAKIKSNQQEFTLSGKECDENSFNERNERNLEDNKYDETASNDCQILRSPIRSQFEPRPKSPKKDT